VLQPIAGVIKVVGLEVTAAISTHQIIVQLFDTNLKVGVLLKKLSVTLLNVLDGMILGLHLVGVLLQAEALVGASHRGLIKHRAHVLGVVCRERPTRVVGQKLGVTNGGHVLTPHRVALVLNGEQHDGDVVKDRQVVLTELGEGLVDSPLQSVIEVVAPSRGEPSCHAQVREVSRDVHVDLAASTPEPTVQATMVRGSPHIAKAVQHVLEQGGKAGAVQTIAMESSVGSEGAIGVVIHPLKTREK
jgi:hypothetical protein